MIEQEKQSATWYEVIGGTWSPRIVPRLVMAESIAFVFHPNGRKSAKRTNSGSFHKTFEEARDEVLTLLASEAEKHENETNRLKATIEKFSSIKKEDIIHE